MPPAPGTSASRPSVGRKTPAIEMPLPGATRLQQVLMSFGLSGSRPASRSITAWAQTLACEFAEKADFGIAPPMAASPMT